MRRYRVIPVALVVGAALFTESGSHALAREARSLPVVGPKTAALVHSRLVVDTRQASKPSAGWRTYRNRLVGYQISYPATWRVREQTDKSGTVIDFFVKPQHNGGVSVSAFNDNGAMGSGQQDIPNTHCRKVTMHGLHGRECVDSFSNHLSFLFAHGSRTFYITAVGKRFSLSTLKQMLATFRVL